MQTYPSMPAPCPNCHSHLCRCGKGKFFPVAIAFAVIAIAALVIGCGSSLFQKDLTLADDAARANAREYELLQGPDASIAAARAFDRSAYCSTTTILTDHQRPVPEAGISCPPP